MSHRLALCVVSLLGLSGSVARAAEIYVDRRSGVEGHDGHAPDSAVRSISEGLTLAAEGDTVVVADGTYRETVWLRTDGVTLRAEGEVVLEPAHHGVVVEAAGTRVEGVVVRGGDASGTALEVRAGASVELDDVWVDGFDGTGVRVAGAGARLDVAGGGVDGVRGMALVVSEGGVATVRDALVRGFRFDETPAALVQVTGPDARLRLDHSLVSGAPRSCLRGMDGAELEVVDSIVSTCGVENDVTMNTYGVVQATGATVVVTRSLVSGQANAPHERVVSGDVRLDDTSVVNGAVRYAGLADSVGFLSITVDDSPNLDHAMALSAVLDEVGGHLSFFANFPQNLSYVDQGDLLDLVARGHEVGAHAVTNGRLTQEVPLELTWSGSSDAWLEVSEDGTTVTVGDVAPWLRLDLELPAHDTLHELCTALEVLPELTCTVRSDDPSALPIYADPTGLDSGTFVLSAGAPIELAWDRRLPSEGGRHFRNELVEPRALLTELVGQPVTSLAYPGQKHDAWVRAAAEDAGFEMGRGATGYTLADHLYSAPLDRMQAPISLTATAVRGADYASLDPGAQQERVRAFARTWATFALEAGVMGALTVHAAETLDVHEVEWLVDEVAGTGLRLWSVGEVGAWLDTAGSPLAGGLWQGPVHRFDDYRPAVGSDAIDRGEASTERTTDALGQPIYGAPDLGPFEHQPEARMGVDALPVERAVEVYDDGRFVRPEVGVAALSLEPLEGRPVLEADVPRGVWATVTVSAWSEVERAWSVAAGGDGAATCATVGTLPPGSVWELRVAGRSAGVVEAGPGGAASVALPAGVEQVALQALGAGTAVVDAAELCVPSRPDDLGDEVDPAVAVAPLAPGPLQMATRPDATTRDRSPAGCTTLPTGPTGVWALLLGLVGLVRRGRRAGAR